MLAAKSRASGLSVGKNSTMESQSFSSCQYGSKSSMRFVPNIADHIVREFWRKTRGTRTVQPKPVLSCSQWFLTRHCRATAAL